MNLLYTLTTYPPSTGGAQIHQHQLARELSSRHSIRVAAHWNRNRTDWLLGTTLKAPATDLDYVIDGIPVHCFGIAGVEKFSMVLPVLGYYPAMFPAARRIASILEGKLAAVEPHPDLVHHVRIGREPLALASLQHARKLGVPFVLTPVHHPRWTGFRYRLFEHIYRQADAVLALTASEKGTLVKLGVEDSRLHVIGHGPVLAGEADAAGFRARHGLEAPFVLFLGQHYPYKGYRTLLEAAPMVWDHHPEVHFVFVGPGVGGSDGVFRSFSDPRIRQLGTVSLQEKTDALAACTMLAVPSTQESFGGVYTEAWMFQKPVLGCSIPAVSEVISDEVDGFLVPQEPAPLAERIRFVLDHPTLADRMGAAGLEKVRTQYDWPVIVKRVEAVYGELR